MNHRQKQRLARKNRTRTELKAGVGIFETEFWATRTEKIREKIQKTEENRKNKKSKKVA